MDNRYQLRTFDDVPGVYEVADNNITEGNKAVAVFSTDKDILTYCGFDSSKQYRSFNSWAKDIKKMFGVIAIERTWNI